MIWHDALNILWGGNPPHLFYDISVLAYDAFDAGLIEVPALDTLLRELQREWEWFHQERIVPTTHATTDLQRLALDNQNVHTKEVNQLTTDAMKFLLETPVPNGQETVVELETAWSDKNRKKVIKDIKMWYNMSECLKTDDYLYKKMLDGLWMRIKEHSEKVELTQRLWEEASEAVDKCCQGHLSRLANVLVGFMDEVKAEVPIGEILQQKIAVIAAKDIRVEYKVCEAWTVFEDLKIEMSERDAWIEAL